MLVLRRRIGESLVIDGTITIHLAEYRQGVVKLVIAAPKTVTVNRAEVDKAKAQLDPRSPKGE